MVNPPSEGGSGIAPRATALQWLPWTASTFASAQEQDRPILLSISAVWCYWCKVMDQESYIDPDVTEFIQTHFIPVRVDNDHRPEINARYNVGGWPTTAFLTPHGGYIAGATYLPPDQLLAMLMEVQRAYRDNKAQFYDQAAHLLQQRREAMNRVKSGETLEPQLVDRIARRVTGVYDVRNGGFGEDLKFPSAPVLQFLLHLYRTTGETFYSVMLEKSLDNMSRNGLYDPVGGGFFRYSAQADWSQPQLEKMLEDNIRLAQVYLDAHLLLGDRWYLNVADGTLDFLLKTLYDRQARGFRGSQGAHSEYFALPVSERERQTPPPVDPACYVSWSAQAASLLLEAHWKLGRPELRGIAFEVLDQLVALSQTSDFYRSFGAAGPDEQSSGDLLGDWAFLLTALVDGYNTDTSRTHYLDQAHAIAHRLLEKFYDQAQGGFYDVQQQPEPIGYLRVREKPLAENLAAVSGLMKLHQAEPNPLYPAAIENTLSAYTEANREYGESACSYALLVDLFLNPPLEITVEGDLEDGATRDLYQAALRVPYPHLEIRSSPANVPAQAHICLNTLCLPPVSSPEALELAVAEAVQVKAAPMDNIFENFTGF